MKGLEVKQTFNVSMMKHHFRNDRASEKRPCVCVQGEVEIKYYLNVRNSYLNPVPGTS